MNIPQTKKRGIHLYLTASFEYCDLQKSYDHETNYQMKSSKQV